jgi:hypothetical protein
MIQAATGTHCGGFSLLQQRMAGGIGAIDVEISER